MIVLYKRLESCNDCPFIEGHDIFFDCNFCKLLEDDTMNDMRYAPDEEFVPNCPL